MTVRSIARSVGVVAVTAMAASVLAGCAAGTATLPTPSAHAASATRTASSPASAAPTPSAVPASAVPVSAAPTPTAPARADPSAEPTAGGSAAAAAAGTGAGTRSGTCSFDHLSVSVAGQDGGPRGSKDTMNQVHVAVVLHNTGSSSCTVQGWPGVSYVGHGNGTQVGGAAILVRNVPHPTVTLRPGGSAQAYLTVLSTSTLADPSNCTQAQVDGMRVYPPGSKRSFFISTAVVTTGGVCAEASVSLMSVEAFIPNP